MLTREYSSASSLAASAAPKASGTQGSVGLSAAVRFGSEADARLQSPILSRHRGVAADSGPLIRRALLDTRVVRSSILERNILRIGDVFAL